jgi:NAD-dependent dihydropyrimidine dehydrogenase PreA subunit
MSEFIKIEILSDKCLGLEKSGHCVEVCPVDIFGDKDGELVIIEENEDECTLCDLCLQRCEPDAIVIHKLYE